MPAKSRRNRRNIPQSRRPISSPAASDSASTASDSVAQSETVKPERTTGSYNSTAKSTAAVAPTYPYILGEIKWIGIVTAIIVVILAVLYIFLH
jgi:hypothetical protein